MSIRRPVGKSRVGTSQINGASRRLPRRTEDANERVPGLQIVEILKESKAVLLGPGGMGHQARYQRGRLLIARRPSRTACGWERRYDL